MHERFPVERFQNVTLTPICAANGMPTVVPGPKKSPNPPSGISSCFRLVTGAVWEQDALVQTLVTLVMPCALGAIWDAGTGSCATLTAKFAPGLFRLNRLKNSMNGSTCQRSLILNGRVTRRSDWM